MKADHPEDIEDIKELIAQTENEQVEFKETTGQLERGMETLCAFLNGEGGTVLFGITDKGKNRARGCRCNQKEHCGGYQQIRANSKRTRLLYSPSRQ